MITVERWYQYKLGRAPFAHDERADQEFDTMRQAEEYVKTADSGIGGDMRYQYKIKQHDYMKLTGERAAALLALIEAARPSVVTTIVTGATGPRATYPSVGVQFPKLHEAHAFHSALLRFGKAFQTFDHPVPHAGGYDDLPSGVQVFVPSMPLPKSREELEIELLKDMPKLPSLTQIMRDKGLLDPVDLLDDERDWHEDHHSGHDASELPNGG